MFWVTSCLLILHRIFVHGAVADMMDTTNTFKAMVDRSGTGETSRIVDGEAVPVVRYPYQVALIYRNHFFCGGSIISPQFVLTAAHCFEDIITVKGLKIRAGSTFASSGGRLYSASSVKTHPQYSSPGDGPDVAVVVTAWMALNGVTTKAVRLPWCGDTVRAGRNLVVTGWGTIYEGGPISNVLRAVSVPVTTTKFCKKVYKGLQSHMFCAGYQRGKKDSCKGDSGGPAVGPFGVQYGIVSFGDGCARPGHPGVYTSVPAVRAWIYRQTGS